MSRLIESDSKNKDDVVVTEPIVQSNIWLFAILAFAVLVVVAGASGYFYFENK